MEAKHKHNLSSSTYRQIRINEICSEEVKMECFAFAVRGHCVWTHREKKVSGHTHWTPTQVSGDIKDSPVGVRWVMAVNGETSLNNCWAKKRDKIKVIVTP